MKKSEKELKKEFKKISKTEKNYSAEIPLRENQLTEQVNPRSKDLDIRSIRDILQLIHEEDQSIHLAIQNVLPEIEKAVKLISESLKKPKSRLFYIGAGTSGRLGMLDAVECPVTFGISSKKIQGILAGGKKAMTQSIEGSEDHSAKEEIQKRKLAKEDILFGISAGSTTTFVITGLQEAKKQGSKTILLTCNPTSSYRFVDLVINPIVGPEILTGSTRMKAGTATKLILNMISTTVMIQLGFVYQNFMVGLKINNQKLLDRAIRILQKFSPISRNDAKTLLLKTGDLKLAIVMTLEKLSRSESQKILKKVQGFLREIIEKKHENERIDIRE